MLSKSAKSRLIFWVIVMLAATSAVSIATCYISFIWLDVQPAQSIFTKHAFTFKLSLIIVYLLYIAGTVMFFRWIADKCLQPLHLLTKKCSEITIHTLDARFPAPHECQEAKRFVEACNAMLARLEVGAQRMRQFSGNASHELRTPLTILRGETEVALRWGKSIEEFRTTLQSNMEEIDRMGRIIEDLLTLAKSEAGELPMSITTVSISDLLQELYLQGKTLAKAKHIELQFSHVVAREITLAGDSLRLRQMFLNLLANAINYTDDHGQIIITLDCNDQDVIVTISDNGIGIGSEHLPHIFDRFYRTDQDRNRSSGGTGLGLSIVKWIAEIHHGSITVTSTLGTGSSFTINLPKNGLKPKLVTD